MKKNLQRMVAIGLLCAMTATRLMQGKAEFISAKDTVKEYVLTVDNEKDFNKIKKQYKENIVEEKYEVEDVKPQNKRENVLRVYSPGGVQF